MVSFFSLSYLLAVSLQELFPQTEIDQIQSTDRCFFCDFRFEGEFSAAIMSLVEERMRAWVSKKAPFRVLEMKSDNAVQFLEHQGEKKLAGLLKQEEGLVTLLQLDRFFFKIEGEPPSTAADVPFFKLVCFWPLKNSIRLIGVGAFSKEELKEKSHALKTIENLPRKLEKLKLVSWIGNQLIWESAAETLKDHLKKKIIELYQGFDRILIPEEGDVKKILNEWVSQRLQSGFQFQKNLLLSRSQEPSQEPWDTPSPSMDLSWGHPHNVNSFLHIITKFLTISSFDYEIMGSGPLSSHLEKALRAHPFHWTSKRGKSSRLEFLVRDRLGQKWLMSCLEWDQKLLRMTLCSSFERWVALAIEIMDIETLLNRLKLFEN